MRKLGIASRWGLLLGLGFAWSGLAAQPPVSEVLADAEAAFAERFQPARMSRAIALYESLLERVDSLPRAQAARVLNRLSQLHYERAEYDGGAGEANRERYAQGKDYGLRSLALNARFKSQWQRDFDAAVAAVTDPAALLWSANNWGRLLGFQGLGAVGQLGQVRALYARCIAVDETFWGASCHNALGAMLATTPGFLGGDFAAAESHLQRARELAPDYLTNRTAVAEFLGFTHDVFGKVNGVRDPSLIERELNAVLAAPIGDWPFWNRLAQRRARELLELLGAY